MLFKWDAALFSLSVIVHYCYTHYTVLYYTTLHLFYVKLAVFHFSGNFVEGAASVTEHVE